jgi:ABC-type xylose transport system substrate-binding protein
MLKYKNPTLLILFFLFSISLQAKPKSVKIGILLDDFNSARWYKDSAYMGEKIRELGHIPVFRVCDSDTNVQVEQARELVQLGVKALIVVAANSHAAAKAVKVGKDANLPVICYDRLIYNSDFDYFVAYDGVKIGEMQAQYVVDKLKGSGKIILLNGPMSDANSVFFKQGQMNVLKPYIEQKKIELLYDKDISEWTAMEAMMEASNYLATSDAHIDAIIAANDGIAEGVIDALQSFRPTDTIIVTGQDGTFQNCLLIKKGSQTMTVFKPLYQLAYRAAEVAVHCATKPKKKIKTSKTADNGFKKAAFIELVPLVIDQKNVQKVVFDSNYYDETVQP